MEMYYSDKEGASGFYSKELHGNKVPENSIELTADEYEEALRNSCAGKLISIVDGKLVYSDRILSTNELESIVISKRNRLLVDSDWTILPDSPFTEEQRAMWREYRQALRDITKHQNFPDVQFPEKPF